MAKVLIFAYFVKNLIEMRRAEDIVAISIPFTAGVAVAAALQPGGGDDIWMAAFSSAVLAFLFPMICRSGDRSALVLGTYFMLGLLCHATSSYGISSIHESLWAEKALAKFCNLIDSLDFRHESTGPLVKALLTGQRSDMDKNIVEWFRASGASHILALSGLHLGVIYGILRRGLSLFGNSCPASIIRSMIIIGISALYVLITGASPSIVRAFLFITIRELSRLLPGRRHSDRNTYCTALTIQLCICPTVISSIGFQLSYLAMLGIFSLFPVLDSWYPPSPRFNPLRKMWSAMALSISCQVFTAPLVWLRFHNFPKYFLLTNLIALPITGALITSASFTILLAAFGLYPEMAKGLTDLLGQALITCLNIISSM